VSSLVLVVDDERKIRELVRSYLERAGIDVLTCDSGAEALSIASRSRPDLVILDLGLPDVPGDEVARELRRSGDVPILMLTARATEADRILGLELGADDYVTKPFSPRELVLRVEAVLRRGHSEPDARATASYGAGEIVLDADRREVLVRGTPVDLTPTEWDLLRALARTSGRVYSRFELINQVRGYEFEGYERTIDSHIKNLRRKLERDPHEPRIIETVLGVGYRLTIARD